MIKAVFLDFYNTIVYFVPPRDERQSLACKEFGIEVEPSVFWRAYIVGEDFWTEANARFPLVRLSAEELETFYAEYEQVLLKAAGVEVSRELAHQIYKRYSAMPRELAIFDDVRPTISALRDLGLKTGLISNADRDVAPMCSTLGVDADFDFILSSCVVGHEKPAPEIFRAALDLAGVEPHEAVHVGDQYKSDVAGALGVGIKPLLLDRYGMLSHLDGCAHISSLREILVHLTD